MKSLNRFKVQEVEGSWLKVHGRGNLKPHPNPSPGRGNYLIKIL